jgi:hypothetical protein
MASADFCFITHQVALKGAVKCFRICRLLFVSPKGLTTVDSSQWCLDLDFPVWSEPGVIAVNSTAGETDLPG